ncbi:E3 ubiquitin-protein ligase ATL4 [Heracleum sosnowskyi]|uniref:E3 ubiquitin-protein ligase ATL4 n=1 Tax=Heracleum sosnowskyi TaxID=360622 RepID=A0AAD8H3C8_9APIA|nr:E3 ubiquitin-protein ligase ATL4 [Heracleum sosnowskyi]
MVDEIVTCVMLLITGIAILVIIHVWIVARAFGEQNGVGGTFAIQRRIVSIDEINKLPCFDYKVEVDEESQSYSDCAVCLEIFKDGDKCRLLPNCKHTFHTQCIDSWLSKMASCPMCRTALDISVCSICEAGAEMTGRE